MKTSIKHPFIVSALIAGLGLMLTGRGMAQTFRTLYSFTGGSDSAGPGWLISSGNTLYGTAGGTLFSVHTDGTGFSTFYSGSNSPNDLILSGGFLYGAGGDGDYGSGTVVAIHTDGTGFTTLYSFTPTSGFPDYVNSDGAFPQGLILSGNTLYGTTTRGGNGSGTVFSINTDGTGFTTLYSFGALSPGPPYVNSDGAWPGILILSGNSLYGTAHVGGSSGNGIVFTLNTDGTGFKTLHSFTAIDSNDHNADGAFPRAGLILSSNTLYGTADFGGSLGSGTVFKVNTNGTGFRTVHSFSSGVIVTGPGGLVMSGNILYGTTYGGVSASGSVFSVKTDGTGFTTLYSFTEFGIYADNSGQNFQTNSDGVGPGAPFLVLSSNTLYGTCSSGGSSGLGTVFSLALPVIPPQLTIIPSGANVILTWPTNYAGFDYSGFTLQSTTNLVSPAIWTTNSPAPVIVNGQNTVTNPIFGTQQFFRLSP